jgi:hypothetical protein
VSPLKIKIPSKDMHENRINAPKNELIHARVAQYDGTGTWTFMDVCKGLN